MKNPLHKRIPREFIGELGRYAVIFLFMTFMIAMVSGFLVAADSMLYAYNNGFEKYNIEDGHFELENKAVKSLLTRLQDEDMDIYELFYKNIDTDVNGDGEKEATVRIYKPRQEVNKLCLMDGEYPKDNSQIAIDRMFADNNHLKIGDTIDLAGEKLTISGLVAFSDYSCLFENNNDLMFDSIRFSVAIVTEDEYNVFPESKEHYNYAWKYHNPPKDKAEANDMADDFIEVLAKEAYTGGNAVEDVVPEYANNAIIFTGDDMGSDSVMMAVLLYILVVILAFIFAVTTKHTIAKEAAVIGTLRASGYTRGELFRHYMTAPMIITFVAAIIGNILGYSAVKGIAADMYYGSYSLPTYVTIWNADAFVKTTVVPIILVFFVNACVLHKMLKISPLRFIRRDIAKTKRKKAVKLPHIRFFSRFQIRVVLQNMSSYAIMLCGIAFVSLLLLFGMIMEPLLTDYQQLVVDTMPATYQYVLKTQVETDNPDAEKYSMIGLEYRQGEWKESISVYGLEENSKYIPIQFPEDGVIVSEGYLEKYGLKVGDEITLHESYGEEEYHFKIAGSIYYPTGLAVFMERQKFNDLFDMKTDSIMSYMDDMEMMLKKIASPDDTDYFTGYFSNDELTDIAEKYIASVITVDDMTKVTRQLKTSMGTMFGYIKYFALIMAAMLIYLLTKLILEKNTNSISMVKILGYENGEIARLYLMSTTWVVLISTIIGLAVSSAMMIWIYHIFMMSYSGWITMSVDFKLYPTMVFMMMAAYAVIAGFQFAKIKKIPMDEALKNVE